MRVKSNITVADLNAEIKDIAGQVQFFDEASSSGRFPAGITVVRLAKDTFFREHGPEQKLRIQPLRGYEGAYWDELFDGTPQIREVVSLHKKSVRGDHVVLQELFHAAEVANNRLLLIYGYDNSNEPWTCRVQGLLYELPSGNLLAGVQSASTIWEARAAAKLLPDHAKPKSKRDWAFFVDHLAFRGFEHRFRECVWNFIDRDEGSGKLQPNPFEGTDRSLLQFWRQRYR